MPVIEIAVLIEVGAVIGTMPTILLIVGTAVLGTVLLRQQGMGVLRRTQESLNKGEMPVAEVFEGVCLLTAGALLLTPGFVTDAVGFVLLVPPARRWLGRLLLQRLLSRTELRHVNMGPGGPMPSDGQPAPADSKVVEGDFQEVPKRDPTKR